MSIRTKYRKPIAAFLLALVIGELLIPTTALALTSGPVQPEVTTFKPAGLTDMVDMFTGNFSYNLPVLDVDGYPINLSYQSGMGNDDEASWVGFGWNINIGSITRQARGVPDDFSGDEYVTDHYTKPNITVGGRVSGKTEVAGFPLGFGVGDFTGSLSLGVFNNNYTGIGAELGANAGLSWMAPAGGLTSNMGVDLLSNTSSGIDVARRFSLEQHLEFSEDFVATPGFKSSDSYNTRGGLKERTWGMSLAVNESGAFDVFGKTTSYNTPPLNPRIKIPFKSTHSTVTYDLGPSAWLIFTGGGITGYKLVSEVKYRDIKSPAYGFLYADRGKNRRNAIMDMLREKENPIIPELPNLAVPVATPDLFSYTSQLGAGQFRLYRGGTGIFFDNEAVDEVKSETMGFDAGAGVGVHSGVNLYNQDNTSKGGKWVLDNAFMGKADFQSPSANPKDEHVFFKQVGEMTQEDEELVKKLQGTEPVAVAIDGRSAKAQWRTGDQEYNINSSIVKTRKEKRKVAISYLTAGEASKAGLDKQVKSYAANDFKNVNVDLCNAGQVSSTNRITEVRKKDHISEITITDEAGKRNVYGIPVYNKQQVDISYAIGKKNAPNGYVPDENNLVTVSNNGAKVRQNESEDNDNYLHSEHQPAYASSYLLTGILSPDYVDVTGNGITDDDLGTAVKFNYSNVGDYVWRTPFGPKDNNNNPAANKATVSRGLLADPDDDKASFVYGKRELWYPHSIETKTKIAFFITGDRSDAMGVDNWMSSAPGGTRQKQLKEIRLYSKADLTRPIKIVKFEYDYSLCRNVPNFLPTTDDAGKTAGKLTLTRVSFQYGNSPKGANHPYKFQYNTGLGGSAGIDYGFLQTDRWGTYKPKGANVNKDIPFKNDEYPYTLQASETEEWAGLWQLNQIELPTGGTINVSYESDSYSYVQNRRAMEMLKVEGLIKDVAGTPATELSASKGIKVKVPPAPDVSVNTLQDFFNTYLNGSSYIYTKLFVNVGGLDAKNAPYNDEYYDFVPCYARITAFSKGSSGEFNLIFEDLVTDGGLAPMNPILQAAYQKLKLEYPRYAYPGYKNRIKSNSLGTAANAAVSAIVNSVKNLSELKRNFYEKASKQGFANYVNLDKSFVRLAKIDAPKKGGGARVKKIMMTDNWATMSGDPGNLTRTYGQEYQYELGVASNEPNIGSDENPLRMPVPYMQYVKKGLDNYFNLEEPFGEYYFPAPTVGYGKVTVRDLGAGGVPDPENRTGYVVNEFYTAKDFPVITRALTNKLNQHGPTGWYSFFGGSSVHEMTFSQGYAIELNDMHGKPRAVRVYNKPGKEISSAEYFYRSEKLNAGESKLKNDVSVVNAQGDIEENKVIGREIEVFTDMRQQETNSVGQNVMFGMDLFYVGFLLVPFTHFPYRYNEDYRLFRSACTMKVIHSYGIVEKVVKRENGSSVESENLIFDAATGQPLVTKTQNEFRDPVYTVNFPAYWMHPTMGAAVNNLGTVLPGFSTDALGVIENQVYADFVQPGDELVSLSPTGAADRYWIIESAPNNGVVNKKKLVDRQGNLVPGLSGQEVKIIRSGFRNVLGAAAASMVCLRNPVSEHPDPATGKKYLVFSRNEEQAAWKVLTASAAAYDDNWSANPECLTCSPGYVLNDEGLCERLPIENSSACFALSPGSASSNYGVNGAWIYVSDNSTPVNRKSFFWGGACSCPIGSGSVAPVQTLNAAQTSASILSSSDPCGHNNSPNVEDCANNICGRLVKSGIWLSAPDKEDPGDMGWIDVEFCLDIKEAGEYFIGYAGDNKLLIDIDGQQWKHSQQNDGVYNWENWYVRPYTFLKKKYKIRLQFASEQGGASAGFEVYKKTYAELIEPNVNLTDQDIIFSTARDLLGKRVQVYREVNGVRTPRYTCPIPIAGYDACEGCGKYELDRVVNPYVNGAKGNWRPSETKVFQVDRNQNALFDDKKKGVDVRNSGTFASFKPFWHIDGSTASWKSNTAVQNWVTANTVTLYDKYGQELENKDALGRYTAASFAFNGQLPNAVASNARSREILFESFEDIKFNPCPAPEDKTACYRVALKNGSVDLKPDIVTLAHSGNYALKLKAAGLTLDTKLHREQSRAFPYLYTNDNGEYTLTPEPTVFPLGFEPMPQTKYVFSTWVRENQPTVNTNAAITLSINGVNVVLKRKAYVEKWSLLEGIFEAPVLPNLNPKSNADFSLKIMPAGGDVEIDDIRLHPFDSHMKSYAYDDKTLRLMAEMDENCFATFYEYDNEGGLVRVKKETERGIMTIKESRSSQTRRNN